MQLPLGTRATNSKVKTPAVDSALFLIGPSAGCFCLLFLLWKIFGVAYIQSFLTFRQCSILKLERVTEGCN